MPANIDRSEERPTIEDVSRFRFEVAYDGPDLANGEIDVRELSPALMALADLCTEAAKQLNGPRSFAQLKIKARPKAGSFGIEFDFLSGFWHHAQALLTGNDYLTAKEIVELLFDAGMGVTTLTALVKKLRGRRAKVVRELPENRVELDVGDGQTLIADKRVASLAENPRVRKELSTVVAPLAKDGIDSFRVKIDAAVVEEIADDDLPAFTAAVPEPEPEQVLGESTTIAFLELVRPSFAQDLKWTVSDGEHRFPVTVTDPAFIERVQGGEKFGVGDILKVDLSTTASRGRTGLSTKHEISRVHEVLHKPTSDEQATLPATTPAPVIPEPTEPDEA